METENELPGKNARAMLPLLEELAEKDSEIERLRDALQPFADVGDWFFARPQVPDETPVVELLGLNGQASALTRGQFKAANLALRPQRIR